MKNLALLLLISTLLTGCGPAVLPPPSTVTLAPSRTPRPTQTATPTATPFPSLQTEGPYLLFTYDYKNFTIMDADGSGRKQFQLPNDGYVGYHFEKAVSPDGKWMAYFTGSTDEPYDLALNLFNLEDETTLPIAKLIAPGFPENLVPLTIADSILLGGCDNDLCRIDILQYAFNEGIQTLDWSPDSQFLAFAGQIDGPSSDVYIFSVHDKSNRQLVSDLENIWQIDWSPNGKRILYKNSTPGVSYIPRYLYIADPESKVVQSPKSVDGGLFWVEHGWITDNSYLISNSGEGAPPEHIRYINTDTMQVKEIWPNEAQGISIDITNSQVVLTMPEYDNTSTQGIYVVSTDGEYKKISNDFYYLFDRQNISNVYFGLDKITDENYQLVGIYPDGSIIPLSFQTSYSTPPFVSPDRKWVMIKSNQGIGQYSADLQLIRSWDFYPTEIIWHLNSTAVFLYDEGDLYYLSISDGEPKLIDTCSLRDCFPFN